MKTSLDNGQRGMPWSWCRQRSLYRPAAAIWVIGLLAFTCIHTALAGKPTKPPKPPPNPTPVYDYVRLGDLGGTSLARDINAAGCVVGYATTPLPDWETEPFLVVPLSLSDGSRIWNIGGDQNELMIPLGTPPNLPLAGFNACYPLKMTDDGFILGRVLTDGSSLFPYWVVAPVSVDGDLVWNVPHPDGGNALMQVLQFAVPPLENDVIVFDVNNNGVMCGRRGTTGFVLTPRTFAVLETGEVIADYSFTDENGDGLNDLLVDLGQALNGVESLLPAAINDAGWVVGIAGNVLWVLRPETVVVGGEIVLVWHLDEDGDGQNDLVQALPLDRGITLKAISAISANGNIAGYAESKKAPLAAAWLCDADTAEYTFVNLGAVPGEKTEVLACDINDAAQVVGYGYTSNQQASYQSSGFLWDTDTLYTLSEILPVEPGNWSKAWAINNEGLIVGDDGGYDEAGIYDCEAFVAIPIEP